MTATGKPGIRNLLVAYNGGPASASALEWATRLAIRHGAHLTGLLAHGSSPVSRSIPGWFPNELRDTILATLAERATKIREAFEVGTAGALPPARLHWLEIGGDPDKTISDYSRMYDLTVMGQFESIAAAGELVLHPARVIEGSGRPVVVVPSENRVRAVNGHAVIAWDGMRAITGAVADGLPLIADASRISVLSIEDGHTGSPLKGIDVVGMLGRHGLTCDWERIEPTRSTAEEILAFCREREAALLVMGISSHSWVGRTIAGSVTTQVLEKTPVPVLMSQ